MNDLRDACVHACETIPDDPRGNTQDEAATRENASERVCTCGSNPDRGVPCYCHRGETVMAEAERLVYGDRQAQYGPGDVEMTMVGDVWSVILGHPVSGYQAALCMAALKLVRAANGYKRDHLVDGCGYLGLAQRVVDGEGVIP